MYSRHTKGLKYCCDCKFLVNAKSKRKKVSGISNSCRATIFSGDILSNINSQQHAIYETNGNDKHLQIVATSCYIQLLPGFNSCHSQTPQDEYFPSILNYMMITCHFCENSLSLMYLLLWIQGQNLIQFPSSPESLHQYLRSSKYHKTVLLACYLVILRRPTWKI